MGLPGCGRLRLFKKEELVEFLKTRALTTRRAAILLFIAAGTIPTFKNRVFEETHNILIPFQSYSQEGLVFPRGHLYGQ
jgi:hypothetical protein